MTHLAPETEARQKLKALLVATYGADTPSVTIRDDYLHASLGTKGIVAATSPVRSRPNSRNNNVLDVEILVQFFGRWKKEINPDLIVDPSIVESEAERFREALRTGDPNTAGVWFFNLVNLDYPLDPGGNKTRFEATIVAKSNNTALLETVG